MRTPPPWWMVTLSRPATGPEKVTTPSRAALTGVPSAAARSTPQWPAYAPCGAKTRTTSPGTGRTVPGQITRAMRGTIRHMAGERSLTINIPQGYDGG